MLRIDRGDLEDAEQLLADLLKVQRTENIPGQKRLVNEILHALAMLRTRQKRYAEARRLFQEVLEIRQGKGDDDHPETLATKHEFGVLRMEQGGYEEAETFLIAALEGRSVKLGPDHPDSLKSEHELILLYVNHAQYDQAEPLLRAAVEGMRQKRGESTHTLCWHGMT